MRRQSADRYASPEYATWRDAYRERNREKLRAYFSEKQWEPGRRERKRIHKLVFLAVRRGELARATCCERCSVTGKQLEGHHPDYSRPLEVLWLCRRCHKAVHREESARFIQSADSGKGGFSMDTSDENHTT